MSQLIVGICKEAVNVGLEATLTEGFYILNVKNSIFFNFYEIFQVSAMNVANSTRLLPHTIDARAWLPFPRSERPISKTVKKFKISMKNVSKKKSKFFEKKLAINLRPD